MNTITNMLHVINPYMLRIEEPTFCPIGVQALHERSTVSLPPSNVLPPVLSASEASIVTQRTTPSLPPSNMYTTHNERIGASEGRVKKEGRGAGVRAPTPLGWGLNLDRQVDRSFELYVR